MYLGGLLKSIDRCLDLLGIVFLGGALSSMDSEIHGQSPAPLGLRRPRPCRLLVACGSV